jgi:hypothetical protein
MKKHSRIRPLVSSVILPLLAAAVLLFFLTALGNLGDGQRSEGKAQLEAALHRAAVACYACEGIYPPSLDYLKEHYGIQIDHSRYVVIYEAFAENLMPDITVLEKR